MPPPRGASADAQEAPPNPRANLRVSDFLPSKFDGNKLDETQAHLLSFEDYCSIHNVADADKPERFRTTLSGQARLWIENFKNVNWNDLKAKFSNRFSDVQTREAALGAFRTCIYKNGESVDTYLSRLRRLADRLNYADTKMIQDQFLSGLPADAKISVLMARPVTLEDAAYLAQQYLDLQRTSVPREVSFACQDNSFHDKIDTLTEEINRLKVDRDRHISNNTRESNSSRDSSLSDNRRPRGRHPSSRSRDRYTDRSRDRSNERFRPREHTPHRGRERTRGRGRGRGRFAGSQARGRCYCCDSTLHYQRDCPHRMQDGMHTLQQFGSGIGYIPNAYTNMHPAPDNNIQYVPQTAAQNPNDNNHPHF